MEGINTETQFNFTYAPGVSLEQMIGLEMAGEFWSQHLADNVSINIFVEMTDYLPENVIGGALPGIESNVRYEDFRDKLEQDITSDIDTLINYNQQNETDKFTAYFTSQYEEDGYKVDNNEYMKMTRANAKALDLIDPQDTGLDGYILMRDLDGVGDGDLNSFQWHYDYSDSDIPSDRLDFLSVAIHEIGHTLGFISGIDQASWLAQLRDVNQDNENDYFSGLVGNLDNATPMDMVRFSTASFEASGEGENWIDMSIGGNPFLSFTGSGGSAVAYFSTGDEDLGGDGYQASHWQKQDDPLGIMDPVLKAGQRREISELDIQMFDAIGWDIKAGDASLEEINTAAKQELAEEIISTAEAEGIKINSNKIEKWADGKDQEFKYVQEQASILTPDYLDANNNDYDDRGEQLNEMVENSGDVYEWGWSGFWWGWSGFWWGWSGFWWGWSGFWQSAADFSQDGFWQNVQWQTVEISGRSQSTTETSESNLSGIFINQEQNQDSLVNGTGAGNSLLNQQNAAGNNPQLLDSSTDDRQTENQENGQNLLSGELILPPLADNLVENLLVMPIY